MAASVIAVGGVSSPHSPLDVSSFTEAELRSAVEAAGNWGTYVTVHDNTPAAVQRAIPAGVNGIDHAHLIDEATARILLARVGEAVVKISAMTETLSIDGNFSIMKPAW